MEGELREPSHSDPLPPRTDGEVAARRRKRLVLTGKIALAASIVGWLCTGRLDLRQLASVPLSFDLALLIAILFVSMLLPALRWWWLLRIQQVDASLWQATKLTWVGYATALILPGAVGGDLAKSYLIVRAQPTARARSWSTVLVDRLIGLYSLILLGCLSAGWLLAEDPAPGFVHVLAYLSVSLLVGSSLGLALVLLGPWRRMLARYVPLPWMAALRESYDLYRGSKRALAGCLAISLVSSTLTAASLAAADRVLGGDVSWSSSLLVGPLVVLANSVPITPGGIGVAETTASELFNQFGSANGAEMMLAIRLVMAAMSLPALLILFGRQRNRISSSPQLQSSVAPSPIRDRQPSQPRAA
jgi:glycosyltransferase 2 family protein